MGSLPHISVAGGTATGTHGSGDGNGVLATSIAAVDLVTADGSLITVDRSNPDLAAIAVGLGAFGVISRLTLDIQPTFRCPPGRLPQCAVGPGAGPARRGDGQRVQRQPDGRLRRARHQSAVAEDPAADGRPGARRRRYSAGPVRWDLVRRRPSPGRHAAEHHGPGCPVRGPIDCRISGSTRRRRSAATNCRPSISSAGPMGRPRCG